MGPHLACRRRHARAGALAEGIGALCDERRARIEAARRDGATERSWLEEEILDAEALLAVVETLADRLADLFPERAAADFLGRLRALVADYLDPRAAGMEEVLGRSTGSGRSTRWAAPSRSAPSRRPCG